MRKYPLVYLILFITIILFILLIRYKLKTPDKDTLEEPVKEKINPTTATDVPCDATLWEHIYHRERLKVKQKCMTVTGTVDEIRIEEDGDDHILLHLDPGQENLLNDGNISDQHGDLILEPICVNEITQEDAIKPCSGYVNGVTIPSIGAKVSVTGTYVLDTEHGWMEIHPVTKITIK